MIKNYAIEVLHWAGMNDNCLDDLKYLLFDSPELINSINDDNENALIIAARENNIEIVKYLVEETAIDIHTVSKIDGNAFLSAVKKENIQVAMYLANVAKLDMQCVNSLGKNAYHLISVYGNSEFIEFLMKNNVNINHLDNNDCNCMFDLLENYPIHKDYLSFDLFENNINHSILFKPSKKGLNVISYMDFLIDSSRTPIQRLIREEYYIPLQNLLRSHVDE